MTTEVAENRPEQAETRVEEIKSDLKRLGYDPKIAGHESIVNKLLDEMIVELNATGRKWRREEG